MRAKKLIITIGYGYIDPATFETVTETRQAKAQRLTVYQNRLNEALIQGVKVNGRYRVRDTYKSPYINWVEIGGVTFKVNTVYDNVDNHYIEIEVGEVLKHEDNHNTGPTSA